MFNTGCAVVKEAIDADNKKQYAQALALYEKALRYFIHVIKCM